tara:strand:+ start:4850 stop:5368 length:519 start_codon:yes stop_codon:yes gene_type:complete
VAESLNDLVEGVQYAVMEAQEIAEEHHMSLVSRFFEEIDGRTQAITQQVHVPNMNPDTREESPYVQMDVPLICLAQLGGIKIKELKVTFVANLSSLDTSDDASEADDPPEVPETTNEIGRRVRKRRRKLQMGMKKSVGSKDDTKATIEISFIGTEPPEGVVRVNDRLLKTLP